MRSLHWAARGLLTARGYEWETRRSGELLLGFWRKSLRTKDPRNPYPKRFVLFPGFGDTPMSWYLVVELLLPFLKRHYDEVILFDFPGFAGFLSREKAFPSMDLLMSSTGDALDSLKPDTILGHSLGGWLVGHYAAECGSGARPVANPLNYAGPKNLILVNSSGIYPDDLTKKKVVSIFDECRADGFAALRPHLFENEPFWFRLIAPDFEKFLRREDILQFMTTVREDHVLEKVAHQIRAKVWLVWGENDTLVPANCTGAWFQYLNPEFRAEHHAILIRGVGHSPHVEKPAITAAVIAQIIAHRAPHERGQRWWKVLKNEVRALP